MIFLTLGTQLPFERLVRAVDAVAATLDEPVFGQIGKAGFRPGNFECVDFLTPREFKARFAEARVIVSHAGIGTILTGLEAGKPLVLMPRQASLGEHRNDHQRATVAQVRQIAGIHVAETADEIAQFLSAPDLQPMKGDESPARRTLVGNLRRAIFATG